MEEIDNIVIHSLRQVGCEFEDNILSLRQFSTELVIEGVIRCLHVIDPNLDLPSKEIAPSMVARYNAGTTLAKACLDLGYKGELGYQTFLYSNETDLRNIFLFLIEKLPKESEKLYNEPMGRWAIFNLAVEKELTRALEMPWLPPYCSGTRSSLGKEYHKPYKTCPLFVPSGYEDTTHEKNPALKEYYDKHLTLVSNQTVPHCLATSLLEQNSLGVATQAQWEAEWSNQAIVMSRCTQQEYKQRKQQRLRKRMSHMIKNNVANVCTTSEFVISKQTTLVPKASRFINTQKLQFTKIPEALIPTDISALSKDPTEDVEQEKQISTLQEELNQLNTVLDQLEGELVSELHSQELLDKQLESQSNKNQELEDSYKVKKRTFDLLPDGQANLKNLQAVVDTTTKRLLTLSAQWEAHRVPIINEYRELKQQGSQRLNETQKKREEVKLIREKIKELGEEARHKDNVQKQLLAEYEKLTKDVSRSSYTRRILEIVGNIKKQKAEIDNVLIDTREVQKEINRLRGKLERTFVDTDELIFKNAKKDESVRKAYKYLAALHENSNLLIQVVEEKGAILREIRELEDHIEQEQQKKVIANLDRISADHEHMVRENQALVVKLS